MALMDLYFKVEVEVEDEPLELVVAELERQVRKVHGVKRVEFSNAVMRSE
jgi:hypothetical protein